MIAKRLGDVVQCTMETRGEVEWMHGRELEEGHTHSKSTRIMKQSTISREQVIDVGRL